MNCVINDKLADAVRSVWGIIESEKQKERYKNKVITQFIKSIK